MSRIAFARRIVSVDDKPAIVVAGEVHYFRLQREDWASRLDLLLEAGADTVATYVPWSAHERADASLDLTGRTSASLDLGAFLDLAAARGLRVLLRPGPFVMAEMWGEGVPERVRHEHPEIVPRGWDDAPAPTGDVDYLAPAFLAEVDRWYAAVGAVAAPRMAPVGGPVIAVQLDNEIGMLAWVSNTMQLTPGAVADLLGWWRARYGDALAERYPGLVEAAGGTGVAGATHGEGSGGSAEALLAVVRSPRPEWGRALRVDLGRFARDRFGRYADALEELATRHGMGGVPFLLNIHGTSGGSGASFPIGLSQVLETFAHRPGRFAGSDHYLGDLNLRTAADLHLVNAYMAAASGADQPGSTLEFEAGTGDYGDDLWNDVDPTAVLLKTRLSLAQEHRLLNYYLFAGGTNFAADPPRTDGATRFAITGERHGFAAPVSPEGERGRSFEATAAAMRLAATHAPWLADAVEEHDVLALGMVLDDYLTEYRPPSDVDPDAIGDLEYARGAGPRGIVGRVLLTLGYRYGAVDLQADGPLPHLVVLGSPPAADRAVQERLAAHVRGGGSLLLVGCVPTAELDGTPCTVLAEALGVRVAETIRDRPGWFASVRPVWGYGTERRVGRIETYAAPAAEVIMTEPMTGAACGLSIRAGAGRAVVVGCDFGADLGFWRTALDVLGVAPGLVRDTPAGLLATTTRAADGSRVLHLLNVSGVPLTTAVHLDGEDALDGEPLTVPARSGAMLPLGIRVGGHTVAATAEVVAVEAGAVVLAPATGGRAVRAWLDGVEVAVEDGRVALVR